jgi:hypothetical protein
VETGTALTILHLTLWQKLVAEFTGRGEGGGCKGGLDRRSKGEEKFWKGGINVGQQVGRKATSCPGLGPEWDPAGC